MSRVMAERLREKYFGTDEHPYQIFEQQVAELLQPHHTLLDAGCGRTAPVLQNFRGKAAHLIGIDAVDFTVDAPDLVLHCGDLANTKLPSGSIDVIMARSVVEHLRDPSAVYQEFARILRPGGHFVFLTANFWDYASLIAKAIPNRFHPWIVARTEGREEHDVFPTQYRSNTRRSIQRWAGRTGLQVASFQYLGQYPAYFMFSGPLFYLATLYEKAIRRVGFMNCLQGWILCTIRKPK